MGMCATYYALTDGELAEYQSSLENDTEVYYELTDSLYETEHSLDLDKLWDGLHFLLTGFASYDDDESVKTPEQNALYQGFFGQEHWDTDFVMTGVVNHSEMANIVKALESVDIDERLNHVDFNDFTEKDIYPNFWGDVDDGTIQMLKEYFLGFKTFYQTALSNGRLVLMVIR